MSATSRLDATAAAVRVAETRAQRARAAHAAAQESLCLAEADFAEAVLVEEYRQARGGQLGPAAQALALRGEMVFRAERPEQIARLSLFIGEGGRQ